jgi:Tol biopolymer transport system component
VNRLIAAVLCLVACVASSAQAQTYDPRIAYVQNAGNQNSIVLANQDGSRSITVFSSRKAVGGVDFAPGGGRVAFNELDVLKVLTYTVSNSGIAVTGITTIEASTGFADFSPDGTKLIYVGNTSTTPDVRVVPWIGGASTSS